MLLPGPVQICRPKYQVFLASTVIAQAPHMQYGSATVSFYGSPAMYPASDSYATIPYTFHTTPLRDSSWNMDTGASSHLADNTSILTSFSNSSIYPSVFVGNGNSIPVTHTGYSFLHTSYKPLHMNHILDYQTQKILLRCDTTGDLYPVTQQPPLQTPVVLLFFSSITWHRRLGHPGDDVLRRLESSNLISCTKSKLPALCHACQLGKHVKLPFYSFASSVKSVFEIIHSDIWTFPIPSESGIKYYAIFLDHFSHFVWVYPLHKKSDLFDNFVAFHAYVNKQFNVDIKALQRDHGGEYDNTRFHDHFRQNGIQFLFSCPRTSQQNDKSERMLHTINNLIRTLLFQAHIPPSYWVEALNMAAHLLNILPSTANNNEIPFTKLYNQTPTYEHLRVFRCLCYPHVDVAHKIEPRSTPCIFLGYPANHHGYRCLDLVTNKIIISRHVPFDEDVFPFGNFTSSTKPAYDFLLPLIQTTTNDYQTRRLLLRCDSTSDLYPVTQQPSIQTPVVLLSLSSTTWHRRLGHPGEDVLRRLESNNLISFHKSKSSAWCHACHLGKHVKLSFYSSESSVASAFEIIHSDIWTSLILSESASSLAFLQRIVASLHSEFAMTDLGSLNYFLSISTQRIALAVFVFNQNLQREFLSEHNLYRSLASALQYLTFTRPDLSYAV
ncbi:ribonuclease H-like domain-containing protein [Tanacetum coccineum]